MMTIGRHEPAHDRRRLRTLRLGRPDAVADRAARGQLVSIDAASPISAPSVARQWPQGEGQR